MHFLKNELFSMKKNIFFEKWMIFHEKNAFFEKWMIFHEKKCIFRKTNDFPWKFF